MAVSTATLEGASRNLRLKWAKPGTHPRALGVLCVVQLFYLIIA